MCKLNLRNLFLLILLGAAASTNCMGGAQAIRQQIMERDRQRAQASRNLAQDNQANGAAYKEACRTCGYRNNETHTLSCGHTFCHDCIRNALNNASVINKAGDLRGFREGQLRCLEYNCRRPFSLAEYDAMGRFAPRALDFKRMLQDEQEFRKKIGRYPEGASLKDKVCISLFTQQCPKCKKNIRKDVGCNHMTCVCGEQFCWLCGESWNDYPKAHLCLGGFGKVIYTLGAAGLAGKFAYNQYLEQQMFSPEFETKKEKLSKVEQKAQDRIKLKAAHRQSSSVVRGLLGGGALYGFLQYSGVNLGRFFNSVADIIPNEAIKDNLRNGRLINGALGACAAIWTKSYYDKLNQKKKQFLAKLKTNSSL